MSSRFQKSTKKNENKKSLSLPVHDGCQAASCRQWAHHQIMHDVVRYHACRFMINWIDSFIESIFLVAVFVNLLTCSEETQKQRKKKEN